MQAIHVKRYADHEHLQGSIEPEDKSWTLHILKNGLPHLLLRTEVQEENGARWHGYVALEDFLVEGTSVESLASGVLCGPPCDEHGNALPLP